MVITLKGVIQSWDMGKKHVDLEVFEEPKRVYTNHHMGVDINVNRGKIITFLAALYEVRPGDIIWPAYIMLT